MKKDVFISGVILDEDSTLTYVEVCKRYNFTKKVLVDMLEEGLLAVESANIEKIHFDQKMIDRLQSARRIQQDLHINLAGVALILDLREEINALEAELNILRRQFPSG